MNRAVDAATNQAITDAGAARLELPYAALGPVLEIEFPVAATRRDIPHGLGQVPAGYHVLLASGGLVTAVDVDQWTTTVAWLSASANYARARLVFFTLREGAITYVVP